MNTVDQAKPNPVELRLSILGMRCAGCVSAVETALSEVPGVASVNVNFADHSAMVKGTAETEALMQAVKTAGFDAAVMEGLEDPAEQEQQELKRYKQLMRKAIVAGAVGIPLMLGGHLNWFPEMGTAEGRSFWPFIAMLSFAVLLYSGSHFYVSAFNLLKVRQTNMDTLIALGTGSAWLQTDSHHRLRGYSVIIQTCLF